jgi:hypothetical protein
MMVSGGEFGRQIHPVPLSLEIRFQTEIHATHLNHETCHDKRRRKFPILDITSTMDHGAGS